MEPQERPKTSIRGTPGIKGLGERLECVRQMRRLTQLELGQKAGLKEDSVGHFERGSRQPNAANLRALCLALNVSADYLLDSHEDSEAFGQARGTGPGFSA